ncbi:hypothetical protein WNY37_14725 [Henriciella sp. AS95]|uniref:hypothetical protein n=1 Tax=Henriciella sp. AS95 TaxID=3135782 RepID=UPI003170DBF3
MAQGIERLVKARSLSGRLAWWSLTLAVVGLAVTAALSNQLSVDGRGEPLIIGFTQLNDVMPVTEYNSIRLNLDVSGLWSTYYWSLACYTVMIWAGMTLALWWTRHHKISFVGAFLAVAGLGALILGPAEKTNYGYEGGTERFATNTGILKNFAEYDPNNPGLNNALESFVFTRALNGEKEQLNSPDLAERAEAESKRAGMTVTTERLRQHYETRIAMLQFLSAQYFTANGQPARAKLFLPIDISDLGFHPESQVVLAHRIVWLYDELGVPVLTNPAFEKPLRERAQTWRRLLGWGRMAKTVTVWSAGLFLLSFLIYLVLSFQVRRIEHVGAAKIAHG